MPPHRAASERPSPVTSMTRSGMTGIMMPKPIMLIRIVMKMKRRAFRPGWRAVILWKDL
jgi:hypothetical protein